VSASTYDQVKATADAARADYEAAVAQGRIAHDQGDYSILLADSDGIVVDTLAEPGQVVAAGQTVIKLAHAGPREAAVFLPETIRPHIGSQAQATLYGSKESVSARLRQLSDAADTSTRTFEARYVLQGQGAAAPLGATVTVRLPQPSATDVFSLPNGAITDRGSGPGVWVVLPGKSTVSFRPVKVARIDDENTYILSGIHAGDRIVALGAHLLSEGQQVRVEGREVAAR
jgi:RND family efflux transporter MFP subunit